MAKQRGAKRKYLVLEDVVGAAQTGPAWSYIAGWVSGRPTHAQTNAYVGKKANVM